MRTAALAILILSGGCSDPVAEYERAKARVEICTGDLEAAQGILQRCEESAFDDLCLRRFGKTKSELDIEWKIDDMSDRSGLLSPDDRIEKLMTRQKIVVDLIEMNGKKRTPGTEEYNSIRTFIESNCPDAFSDVDLMQSNLAKAEQQLARARRKIR